MTLMEALIAGGWLMVPLLGCSLVAVAIVVERLWALRAARIAPRGLAEEVGSQVARGQVDLDWLARHSPLGGVLAAGLRHARLGHEQVRARFQEAATAVVHDMERFLSPLGTVASIAPLIGLLGTVVGMIEVFAVLVASDGGERTADLAGGISRALVTTAAGLSVAIPALIFHRYFQRRIEDITLRIEAQAGQVVECLAHHDGELTLAERHESAGRPAGKGELP
ncbi:MotA/TolQ/ExbB proton channel family protein [Halomonas borealis]|jgi:biopolymer transport protein ExbB|uniref:MotA/TolQ/ExbB proton channel family protein n=1 Tax=Halomonas borealis TaxID=2508710 RepID=UPI00109FBC87|nr:MotA/TolQ/ExbB proton channel family protein [Halomonas borealis]